MVVPLNFNLRRIPAIVEQKRAWIETHLRRFADIAAAVARAPLAALPESIELPALGESWRIDYRPAKTRTVGVIVDQPGRITVYGAVHDRDACREVLKRWLQLPDAGGAGSLARPVSPERTVSRSARPSSGVRKRAGRAARRQGTISLSFKLLFLERDRVRCVLLHELCHTVCMNHSPRFWALLGGLEPECRAIHKRMRDGWKRVPAWVEEPAGERPEERGSAGARGGNGC